MLGLFKRKIRTDAEPSTKTLRVLSTFPRSGTHWLKEMIGTVMTVRPREERLRDPEKLKIALQEEAGKRLCYDHFAFDLHGDILTPARYPDLRMVLLFRNPLDTLISQFYVKAQKGTLACPELGPIGDLKKLLRDMRWMENCRENIRVRVIEWLGKDWVCPVRYEDLVADTAKELARALDHLKVAYTPEALQKAIDKNRFEVLSQGRRPGEEDPKSHYRKGVPGDWKKVFDDADLAILNEYIGDYLEKLGYLKRAGFSH